MRQQRDRCAQAAPARSRSRPPSWPRASAALVEERRSSSANWPRRARWRWPAAAARRRRGADGKEVGGVKLVGAPLDGVPARISSAWPTSSRSKIGSGVVALIAVDEGKASLVVAVTDDLTDRINAVELVRRGAAALGGKGGGGRPDMAQGGGPDGAKADEAFKAIEEAVAGVTAKATAVGQTRRQRLADTSLFPRQPRHGPT